MTVGATWSTVSDRGALALCMGWCTPYDSAVSVFSPSTSPIGLMLHSPPGVTVALPTTTDPRMRSTVDPGVPDPFTTGDMELVMLSVRDWPVSVASVRSGFEGAAMVGSMKYSQHAEAQLLTLMFPAASTTVALNLLLLLITIGWADGEVADGVLPSVV